MLRVGFQGIVFLLLAMAAACAEVRKIGPDLYAYVSTHDSSANSTFLIGDKGILVVDTGLNAEEGRKLLEEIRKVSSLPVRWIVNTHYHPDHRGGNSVVGPDAVIISTSFTRGQALRDKQAPDYALNETVEKEGLTLYLGAHEVRVYHPGPAHTRGEPRRRSPGGSDVLHRGRRVRSLGALAMHKDTAWPPVCSAVVGIVGVAGLLITGSAKLAGTLSRSGDVG